MPTLPENTRARFIDEITRAAESAADQGNWSYLLDTVYGWRSTAAVMADRHLAAKLNRPIADDYGPVPEPPRLG